MHLWGVIFDVVELYPTLPTNRNSLAKMRMFLLTEPHVEDAEILTQLLDFLFRYNWFTFVGQFFQQIFGLAMGHLHSPPMANFLMFLLFEQNLDMRDIVLYHRYLNDGVVIFDSSFIEVQAAE